MFVRHIVLGVCVLCLGCGGAAAPIVAEAGPLTVAEWNKMDDMNMKFDPATFDRLKAADPRLQNEKEWDQFMRTVVVPQRKIDIPPRKYTN